MNVPMKRIACDLMCGFRCCSTVEYTPQAYLQSDLQMFFEKYATDLLGKEPLLVSIDGGKHLFLDGGICDC